ncbi:MAG: hypothetical protein HOV86_07460 [Thermoactinospora sp.]|nr:hypothetical protein [Thermoactinospora sp.]
MRILFATAAVAIGLWALPSGAATAGSGPAFTACMRAHGLPDFPEVTFSSDGLVNLDIKGERVDVMSDTYGTAVEACDYLLPDGSVVPGRPQAPPAPDL